MGDRALIKLGPFSGLQTATEPYYMQPEYGQTVSNVDISYRAGAFSSAMGRGLAGTLNIPAGFTITCVAPFVTFAGDNPLQVVRNYVFSATDGNGNYYQAVFSPASFNGIPYTYVLGINPFTAAVQFGSALWTNGGNKLIVLPTGYITSDDWQIQVPSQYSYLLNGTYATTSGNAELTGYTYAITLRRAFSWTQSGSTLYPDPDTYQESSPIFSTSVTTTSGQQPGIIISGGNITQLAHGTSAGSEDWYGALYRSSTINPTYQFVDYLINLTQMNDHSGNPAYIDTNAYATIANNAYLTTHHDPPPIVGQTYPGIIATNSDPISLQQSQQQQSFAYTNPAFLAKHKNRLWAFTLYPNTPIGSTPVSSPARISLQPQLWCSDLGVPWSFNDDPANNQVLLVGPEDTPGNSLIDNAILSNPPWQPGLLEDTPMGLATTGSYLVCFKSQSTWVVTGDSPSEFIPRKIFNIGCVSSKSIVEAEGGIFWLAPEGVYFFSGGAPEYIGENIRGYLNTLDWQSDILTSQGSYANRTYYLSFNNQTLCYYVPAQQWYSLPYGADAAVFAPFNQNQMYFVNGQQLQAVAQDPATDLGQPIVCTWNGPVSDSGAPGQLKRYRFLQVVAQQQLGTVQATLIVDNKYGTTQTFSATFDLSQGNGAHVASLPSSMVGYQARLMLTATTDDEATAPLTIRSAVVTGDIDHAINATATTNITNQSLNGVTIFPHA